MRYLDIFIIKETFSNFSSLLRIIYHHTWICLDILLFQPKNLLLSIWKYTAIMRFFGDFNREAAAIINYFASLNYSLLKSLSGHYCVLQGYFFKLVFLNIDVAIV